MGYLKISIYKESIIKYRILWHHHGHVTGKYGCLVKERNMFLSYSSNRMSRSANRVLLRMFVLSRESVKSLQKVALLSEIIFLIGLAEKNTECLHPALTVAAKSFGDHRALLPGLTQ